MSVQQREGPHPGSLALIHLPGDEQGCGMQAANNCLEPGKLLSESNHCNMGLMGHIRESGSLPGESIRDEVDLTLGR